MLDWNINWQPDMVNEECSTYMEIHAQTWAFSQSQLKIFVSKFTLICGLCLFMGDS